MPDDEGNGRHRNVPSRLRQLEERIDRFEKDLPQAVAELVADLAAEQIRAELRATLRKLAAVIAEP